MTVTQKQSFNSFKPVIHSSTVIFDPPPPPPSPDFVVADSSPSCYDNFILRDSTLIQVARCLQVYWRHCLNPAVAAWSHYHMITRSSQRLSFHRREQMLRRIVVRSNTRSLLKL